jgi:hypothetical protein
MILGSELKAAVRNYPDPSPFNEYTHVFSLHGFSELFVFPPRVVPHKSVMQASPCYLSGLWFEDAMPASLGWPLVTSAFASHDHLKVKGWVHVTTSAPSEEDVRKAMARAAAGESVVIPAATSQRLFIVTGLEVSRAPAQAASASSAAASASADAAPSDL